MDVFVSRRGRDGFSPACLHFLRYPQFHGWSHFLGRHGKPRLACLCLRQRQAEREDRAGTRLGADGYLAAMQLDQLFAYAEAEPKSPAVMDAVNALLIGKKDVSFHCHPLLSARLMYILREGRWRSSESSGFTGDRVRGRVCGSPGRHRGDL